MTMRQKLPKRDRIEPLPKEVLAEFDRLRLPLLDRLDRTLAEKAITPRAASIRIGRGSTLVKDWHNAEKADSSPKIRDVAAMAWLLDVSPEWLAFGREPSVAPPPPRDPRVATIDVAAVIEAGPARPDALPADQVFQIAIPVPKDLAGRTLYAAIVRGESMNRVYPDGTLVVLERITPTAQEIVPGERYHYSREAADGLYESTLKTVFRDATGRLFLRSETDIPELEQVMRVEIGPEKIAGIRGRVVMSLRRE